VDEKDKYGNYVGTSTRILMAIIPDPTKSITVSEAEISTFMHDNKQYVDLFLELGKLEKPIEVIQYGLLNYFYRSK
jgi:hypothetical protein